MAATMRVRSICIRELLEKQLEGSRMRRANAALNEKMIEEFAERRHDKAARQHDLASTGR
jgi:hypothetical protein